MHVSAEPWYIFTDASYEPSREGQSMCGIGGVIFDQAGHPHGCFSAELPQELKSVLGQGTSRQMIVGLLLWRHLIEGMPVVFYVDNNSAKIESFLRALGRHFHPSCWSFFLVWKKSAA